MRAVLRVAEWAGFMFCVFTSCLFAGSGQVGFSVAFSVLGMPYLWLLAGAPRPRSSIRAAAQAVRIEAILRVIAQRPLADQQRIIELELQLGYRTQVLAPTSVRGLQLVENCGHGYGIYQLGTNGYVPLHGGHDLGIVTATVAEARAQIARLRG